MSSLATLTANYTDSENEDDSKENSHEAVELSPSQQVSKLVSYNLEDHEDRVVSDHEPESMDLESDYTPEDSDDELPSEPPGRCAPELQRKVEHLYDKVKNQGLDLNKEIQHRKSFRNPSIYEKLIDYCNLDEYGTNYSPDVYNPYGFAPTSFYDELAKIQKIEMDKREKEKKDKTKVEIVSGTAKKIQSNGNVVASTSSSSSSKHHHQSSLPAERKRKSKWDVVVAGDQETQEKDKDKDKKKK